MYTIPYFIFLSEATWSLMSWNVIIGPCCFTKQQFITSLRYKDESKPLKIY